MADADAAVSIEAAVAAQRALDDAERAAEDARTARDSVVVALLADRDEQGRPVWTAYRVAQVLGVSRPTVANIRDRANDESRRHPEG